MAFAVIGLSISGIAAALKLVEAGQQVCLLPHPFDTATLIDMYLVDRTPLNEGPISGEEYERQAVAALQEVGVVVSDSDVDGVNSIDEIEIGRGGLMIHDRFHRTMLEFSAVVFAPNGTAPELIGAGQWERGISFSAASDAPMASGSPVVVIGCDGHALQQVCIALTHASMVTLCCEKSSIRTPNTFTIGLLDHARESGRLDVRLDCRMLPNHSGYGIPGSVKMEAGRTTSQVEASLVFFAHDPVPHWGLEECGGGLASVWNSGLVFPSGLARSVDYMDHPALFQSGIDAALDALTNRA